MTDEAGANANGILEVYGPDAIRKSYTCQFHFKQCLNRRLKTFPSNLNHIKTEFEALCMQLLTCTALTEYTGNQNQTGAVKWTSSKFRRVASVVVCQEVQFFFPFSEATVCHQ